MKLKSIAFVAALSLFAGSALAQGVDTSTPSRADVRASAIAENAKHDLVGEVGADLDPGTGYVASSSMLTRAEVKSEVRKAIADGTLAGPGDHLGYPYSPVGTSVTHFDAVAHPRLARLADWVSGGQVSPPMTR